MINVRKFMDPVEIRFVATCQNEGCCFDCPDEGQCPFAVMGGYIGLPQRAEFIQAVREEAARMREECK